MTIEEAIFILDPKRSKNLTELQSKYENLTVKELTRMIDEAASMGAAALHAQQPPLDRSRWERCERCKSGIPDKGYPHEFWIDDGAIYYPDTEFGWEGENISYCPFCGRPLTEEA